MKSLGLTKKTYMTRSIEANIKALTVVGFEHLTSNIAAKRTSYSSKETVETMTFSATI